MALLISPTVSFLASPSAPRSRALSAAANVSYTGKLCHRTASIPRRLRSRAMPLYAAGLAGWGRFLECHSLPAVVPCNELWPRRCWYSVCSPVPGVLHLCDAVGSLGNSFEHLRRVNFLGAAMPYGPDMPEVYQLDRRIARAAIFFFIFLLYFTASFFTSVSQQCHSMALTLTKHLALMHLAGIYVDMTAFPSAGSSSDTVSALFLFSSAMS